MDFRRAGRMDEAFQSYLETHRKHPESVECLKFLMQLSDQLGKAEFRTEFEQKLRMIERTQTVLTQNPSLTQTRRNTSSNCNPEGTAHFFPDPVIQNEWGDGALGENLLPL